MNFSFHFDGPKLLALLLMASELRIICLRILTSSTQNHLCLLRLMVQKWFHQIYAYICPAGTTSAIPKTFFFSLFFLHHLWTQALLCASVCSLRCWAVVLMWGMQVWIQRNIIFWSWFYTVCQNTSYWEIPKNIRTAKSDYHLWFKPCVMLQHLKKVSSQKFRNSIWPICSAWRGSSFNFYKGYGCADESLFIEINSHEGF